jgi:hypothetical protein
MPNRIIREGILSSDRVEQLDPPAEVFYRRLMSKVDDHGLFDARPSILRTSLYPLRVDRVREADIARWIAACEKAGVIALYQHDGKPYLQMLDTRWQARSEPKYPLPPENSCAQVLAAAPVFGDGDVAGDDTPKAPKGADVRFEEFWKAYPKKVGKDAALKAFEKRKPDASLLARMLSAIDAQAAGAAWLKDGGQYIPNPATWINQGRWQDGESGAGDSAEVGAWHDTRGGVEKRAALLGIAKWDECEQWAFYRARVLAAAKEAA